MKHKIKKHIIFFAVFTVLVSSLYMIVNIVKKVEATKATAVDEFQKTILKTAKLHVEDALRVCQIMHKSNITSYESASEAMKEFVSKLGVAQVGNNLSWAKTYQQNNQEKSTNAEIPAIMFGDTSLSPQKDNNDNLVANNSAIEKALFTIKNDSNIDVSIMAKNNKGNSMLRIATTLSINEKLLLGSTFDDTPETSEIIRTLLARKNYMGVMKISTYNFLVVYEPIIDQYGEVIGAIEYLKNFADLEYVFENLESVRIGEDGYLWGLQLENSNSVMLKFYRDIKSSSLANNDPRHLKEIQDELPEIIDLAISNESKIQLKNVNILGKNSKFLVAFTYYKPWNLILGITINKDNLDTSAKNLESSISECSVMTIPIIVLLLVVAILLANVLAKKLLKEIEQISKSIKLMQKLECKTAIKDISSKKETLFISETEQLRITTLHLSESIFKHLSNIKSKVANFSECTKEMENKVGNIENNSENKNAKLSDIQNSLTQINKISEILNEDSIDAIQGIESSNIEIREGATLLSKLEDNAKSLMSDAQNVALQLSIIKEKADKISNVVSSIKSVGERINMLAVNASMEAEGNKETSAGFKDVANEITKLSDISAVSTMRISEMASTMCKSVSFGVSEMKNFSLIMQGCRDSIKNVRESVSVAQETTLELSPKFDELSKGIKTHTDNISNIEHNLTRLAEKSAENKSTIAQLHHRASTINAIVSTAIPMKLPQINADDLK